MKEAPFAPLPLPLMEGRGTTDAPAPWPWSEQTVVILNCKL